MAIEWEKDENEGREEELEARKCGINQKERKRIIGTKCYSFLKQDNVFTINEISFGK